MRHVLFCSWVFLALITIGVSAASADNYDICYKKIESQYGPYTDITWMQKVWACTDQMDAEQRALNSGATKKSTDDDTPAGTASQKNDQKQEKKKKNNSAASGAGCMPVDEHGSPCLTAVGTRVKKKGNTEFHELEIKNGCKRSITAFAEAAGRPEPASAGIKPQSTFTFQCATSKCQGWTGFSAKCQ